MSPSDGPQNRRQASPVELAALLVQAVCVPGEGEEAAVTLVADNLGLEAASIGEELMYLRAFAIDFAVLMGLGDSPAKDQILSRYYEHWKRIDEGAGGGTQEAMEERLGAYAAAVGQSAQAQGGLSDEVGRQFASRCVAEGGLDATELVVFGGRMFAALYDGVVELLTEVEIILVE
jgi:hypothetical protein